MTHHEITTLPGDSDTFMDRPRRSLKEVADDLKATLNHKKNLNSRIDDSMERRKCHIARWKAHITDLERKIDERRTLISGFCASIVEGIPDMAYDSMGESFVSAYTDIAKMLHKQVGIEAKVVSCTRQMEDMQRNRSRNVDAIEDLQWRIADVERKIAERKVDKA